jgi:hypothetical protein
MATSTQLRNQLFLKPESTVISGDPHLHATSLLLLAPAVATELIKGSIRLGYTIDGNIQTTTLDHSLQRGKDLLIGKDLPWRRRI